ncbi:Rad2 nuclease [Arthrobotrys conoides]|uniref:Rad2 nuclease n=1 Tax=Arthrobotrys conoides TaxID=74498 RepID=A0AAN8PG05_9PEZI
MGISGLLPFLKSIQQPTHIKNWKGKKVAVDAYGWLHRGTISCALDLALDKPTTRYVDYAMHRVRMLQHYGVIPYLVFDGDYLPGKKGTELDREKRRKSSREAGLELLRLGRTSQAYSELQKSIDVTPLMARRLIEELKKANLPYIVAPYEADAQMAYLERIGEVSAILSEDSDLLVFGASCLLTKLDQYGGCIAIHRSDFPKVSEASMAGWSDSEFCRMAILSGCDYLVNIPKMGIKTAYKFVRKYKSVDKILRAIRMDGSFTVPASYEKAFVTAEMTFKYQRVYCPLSCQIISCNGDIALPDGVGCEEEQNFGGIYDSKTACKVASGELDPITKLELQSAPISVSPSSKQKPRITSFFSPRVVLAEIPSPNNTLTLSRRQTPQTLTPSPESTSLNTHKMSLKQNTKPKALLGMGDQKKRRLCMDVENDKTQNTDRSPFFTRPSKSVKTCAKRGVAASRHVSSRRENSAGGLSRKPNTAAFTGDLLETLDSGLCSARIAVGNADKVVPPRNKTPVVMLPEPGSDGICRFKIPSLASFRFRADTICGSLGTHSSPTNPRYPRDKENQHPVHPN